MNIIDKIPENAGEIILKEGYKAKFISTEKYSRAKVLKFDKGYNFLQYQCIIRPLIQKKYGISLRFLEMLLYLYPFNFFTAKDYTKSIKSITWPVKTMLEYDWIKIVSVGQNRSENIYALSNASKRIVKEYYGYMSGEIEIPEFVALEYGEDKRPAIKKRSDLLKKFMETDIKKINSNLF